MKAWARIGKRGERFGPIAQPNESALRTNLLSLATTRTRHVGNDPNVERYDPDLWTDEFYFLNQPGQADIQSDLFYDYRTNVDAYPKWQAWMREKQPRLLVIWGKYDLSFDLGEPERLPKGRAEGRSPRPRRRTFRARYRCGSDCAARSGLHEVVKQTMSHAHKTILVSGGSSPPADARGSAR